MLLIFLLASGSTAVAAPELTDVVQLDSGPIRGKYEYGVRAFFWHSLCRNACRKASLETSGKCCSLEENNFQVLSGLYAFLLAAGKGVVVVTLNYRLGVLGFLTHPLLSSEYSHKTSRNYGLFDQITALKWVQKNIAVFGGNVEKVTILGQEAGAASVALLMISPLPAGLFQWTIIQSGGPLIVAERINTSLDENKVNAAKIGEELALKLCCGNDRSILKTLLARCAQEIVNAAGF
jgi:hypothetical protein